MSGNVITDTWLAWALDGPAADGAVERAMARVGAHYGPQLQQPPPLRSATGPCEGLALWRHDDERVRWPMWSSSSDLTASYANVPADWRAVVDEPDPARAASALAGRLAQHPDQLARLTPPLVLAARERLGADSTRTTIVTDFIGAGRLYEMRLEPGGALDIGGWVWSNRLGALPIFAGAEAKADSRGWLLFAAASFFISDSTPIAGTRKVPPATVIRVDADSKGARVDHVTTDVLAGLVGAREPRLHEAVETAAGDATTLARGIEAIYADRVSVDLSGGYDTRVSAAAAIAAGIDAEFRTDDSVEGELDIAREVLAAGGREFTHITGRAETGEPGDDLAERLAAIHLVHDGMRSSQELRRPMHLPIVLEQARPTMSGHAGDIAHGFYYSSEKALSRLQEQGEDGALERMERAGRRKAPAAQRAAYDLYRDEVQAILDQGRAHGVEGPALLDWFYMVERVAHRSGLGARAYRYSACATPGFIRASFDLTPHERIERRLHNELIAALVPALAEVRYLGTHGGGLETSRERIWEKPGHREAVAEIIGDGGSWTEIFRSRRVRRMWKQASRGQAHPHYEKIFNGIIWRDAFDSHLRTLSRAARDS